MEEGRRMFQIFAARMFEQRVLTAYREKVAQERQRQLIEELEEENRQDVEREAKKAREAQKRKDKKRQQREAKEAEKARREAERAAEEAAKKAEEERRLEEQRRKREEQRKKKEAEKKAQEEERLRKEAERLKRQREERERQMELEKKQREQKEREKKKRDEAKRREKEEREAKEKEAKEKKAKEDRERKAREAREREQKEAAENAERESRERAKREEQQAAQAAAVQAAKRASHPPAPPGLHHHQTPIPLHSPQIQVATPIMAKAPTPVRPRQASHQGSHASSPRSQPVGADVSHRSASPTGASLSQSSGSPIIPPGKSHSHVPTLHHPQPTPPMPNLGSTARPSHPLGFSAMSPLAGMSPGGPPGLGGMPQRFPMGHEAPLFSGPTGPAGGQYKNPDGLTGPPGIASRPSFPGRGFPLDTSHGQPFHPHHQHSAGPQPSQGMYEGGMPGHSRRPSNPVDRNQPESRQGISRPNPIQRPPSALSHEHGRDDAQIDALTAKLGSRALLDDTDGPLSNVSSQPIPIGPGGRFGFGNSPLFPEPLPGKQRLTLLFLWCLPVEVF